MAVRLRIARAQPGSTLLPELALLATFISGCTALPEGVVPVDDFDAGRYLGKWYEIARLDHSFERGLSSVTAEYTRREDGGLDVLNRGYSSADGEWKDAEGKAYFVADENTGHLRVSFFGPFYGSYVVFELDRVSYQYAFVAGYNKSYLWLLARSPDVSQDLVDRFVVRAGQLGFDTGSLIFVEHSD